MLSVWTIQLNEQLMYTNHSLSATSIKHQSACSLSVYICIILLRVVEKQLLGKTPEKWWKLCQEEFIFMDQKTVD